MNNSYGMNNIHDNEINNISKCNLLKDISKHSGRVKNLNYKYYPILTGYMNICTGKEKLYIFLTLLYSRCSSNILMRRLTFKIKN